MREDDVIISSSRFLMRGGRQTLSPVVPVSAIRRWGGPDTGGILRYLGGQDYAEKRLKAAVPHPGPF